jgi:hypothetical protein
MTDDRRPTIDRAAAAGQQHRRPLYRTSRLSRYRSHDAEAKREASNSVSALYHGTVLDLVHVLDTAVSRSSY